ncbi:MAG: cupin domain-containing protein [Bacteroidetes bacterium]|nr:cupin domain-containing protein [Bacteroidota bacterium]
MDSFFNDKILTCELVPKQWGYEKIIVNNEKSNYCGKILHFVKGARFSMHFHDSKTETFLVSIGKLKVWLIDTRDASIHETELNQGDILQINRLLPHEVMALEESEIIEFSTFHRDSDSYRVWRKM